MKFLNYVQTTPAITWTITHNFGQKVVAETWVTVNGLNTKILPKKVTNVDDNTLMVEFSVARSGGVRVVASPFTYGTVGNIDTNIGMFSSIVSSAAVPTSQTLQTVNAPTMDGVAAVGSWNVSDDFGTNTGNLTGRAVEYYTAPPSDPTRTKVWANGGTPDSTVAGGAILIGTTANSAFPSVDDQGEFSNPTGMFIEYKYYAANIDTILVVGFNLGKTNIQVVANGSDGYPGDLYPQSIRVDASGFNGYTQANGDLLAAIDPVSNGSISYTLDRFYSEKIDARGKALRAELTATSFKLIVDGVTVLQQVPRWPVKFFSTAVGDSRYTANIANVSLFKTGVDSETTIDYVRVGAL